MSINRTIISRYIFSALAAYADSGGMLFQYDLEKCYIDFSSKDKENLNAIKNFSVQEFIPNAKFAVSNYKEKKILIIAGEKEIHIDDGILADLDLDLAVFLYSVYELGCQINFNRQPIEVYNDVLCQPEDEDYHGHTIEDLESYFEKITVYEIVENSSVDSSNAYAPYAYYLLKKMQEQPGKWKEKTINIIENILLSGNDKIPYHNIVLALLANQWHHTFLESYRCIERVFSVIKLKSFYQMLHTSLSLTEVSKELEDKISWKPNEKSAIADIFNEIEPLHITSDLQSIKNKSDRNIKMGKWYYDQRNAIAHYRAVHQPLKYDNEEWNALVCFNFQVIEYFYTKYEADI